MSLDATLRVIIFPLLVSDVLTISCPSVRLVLIYEPFVLYSATKGLLLSEDDDVSHSLSTRRGYGIHSVSAFVYSTHHFITAGTFG